MLLFSLVDLLSRYGYAAVFVGALLEGETMLLMAGFAAHRGYLELWWVIVAAFAGGALGDQVVYFYAARHGRAWLETKPGLRARVARVEPHVRRHGNLIIVGFRFLYGLRTVIPIAIALCGVPPRRFVPLSILSAVPWSILVAGAGYFFGQATETVFLRARKYEELVLLSILVLGLARFVVKRSRNPR